MNEITHDLIRRASAGDQGAIAALYQQTYTPVYKTIRALVSDEDAVLDILQDSYVKGFRSLAQLTDPASFPAWMKRIAANQAKDYLKKKKPVLFTDMADESGAAPDFKEERLEFSPEAVMDRQETTRLINEILNTLSEDQRLVIGLFYYEQMSVRQIAELLECSENTVKSRLNYGRKKVEAKVLELEKQGTKLYSMAPVAFLLWLLRNDAAMAELPVPAVLQGILHKTGAVGSASAGGAAAGGASTGSATAGGTAAGGASAGSHAAGVAVKAAAAGAKGLAVKIVAGVIAGAVVLTGSVWGTVAAIRHWRAPQEPAPIVEQMPEATQPPTLPHEQQPAEPAQEETTQESAPQSAISAYEGILANYRSILTIDSEAFLAAPDDFFRGDYSALRIYHIDKAAGNTEPSTRFWYCCFDIDRNGTDELLVGAGTPDNVQIIDLYGFDGSKAVALIEEPTLGTSTTLELMTDNTFHLYLGATDELIGEEYLRVDGCDLVPTEPGSTERANYILWKPLSLDDPGAVAQTAPDQSDIAGLYLGTLGSSLGVRITVIDAATVEAAFSNPFSDAEMVYTGTYQDGLYLLDIAGYEVTLDFEYLEGVLLVEGHCPYEMYDYLGVYEKAD